MFYAMLQQCIGYTPFNVKGRYSREHAHSCIHARTFFACLLSYSEPRENVSSVISTIHDKTSSLKRRNKKSCAI